MDLSVEIKRLEASLAFQDEQVRKLAWSRGFTRQRYLAQMKEVTAMKEVLAQHGIEWRSEVANKKRKLSQRDGALSDWEISDESNALSQDPLVNNHSPDGISSNTPLITSTETPTKTYPSRLPTYDGNVDEWDSWRQYLESELNARQATFTSENDKANFIREHCKGAARHLIDRYFLDEDPYRHQDAFEMVATLENAFGAQRNKELQEESAEDSFAWLDAEPKPGDFMSMKEFISEFTYYTIPLSLSDDEKLHYLREGVGSFKVDLTKACQSYEELVEHLCKWSAYGDDDAET